MADGIWKSLADGGVVSRLLRRGWHLEPQSRVSDGAGGSLAAVICASELAADHPLRQTGKPALTLGASLVPGHLRMGLEVPGGPPGRDQRLARLVATLGETLDDDAVADALSVLPPIGGHRAVAVATAHACCPPQAFSNEVLSSLRAAGVVVAPCPDASAIAVRGAEPALWHALGDGCEIICIGTSPVAGLGLTHDAPTPDDIPAALQSLRAGRANHRDRARRALATEILFNSVACDDADTLAAMIDAGLRAVVCPRRRSVSIVITNHNYRRYLGAAVASAQHQTVPAHEIVVVDDGSTDGSPELITAMRAIIPVLQPNRGQAAGFNAGFARTTGDIVLFLDADDCLLPQAVERVASAELTGASRLFFGLETIDRHGRATGLYTPGTPKAPAASGMLAGAVAAHGIFPFMPTSGNAFPRRVLERLLPMPEPGWRICADLWLVLAASALGEAREIPETLGQYRVHGKNAHFNDLGAEPQARAAHLKRRILAWNGLLSRLPPGVPAGVSQVLRIGLHRCVTIAAARSGRRGALRQIPQALRIAMAAKDFTPFARMSHALLPMRLALRRPADRMRGFDVPKGGNLLDIAGPAGWPWLAPGARTHLAMPSAGATFLGHGWAAPDGIGARLVGQAGTLAFRLPELPCHWRLRIGFEVDGQDPIRKVAVCLNGIAIDELDLHLAGEIDLRIARELLVRWDVVIGAAGGDGSVTEPRLTDPAACLTLRVATADVGRLRLTSLRADVLTTTRSHAPCLDTGRFLSLCHRRSDRRPLACLGSGWSWPDDRGAPLVDASGQLALSLRHGDAHILTLVWDGVPGIDRPAECVMVALNDVLIPTHTSPDGRQASIVLPDGATSADGKVGLSLMAFPDSDTAGWPEVCLTGLRLDRLAVTDTQHGRRLMLAPNVETPAGPLVAPVIGGAAGLVADGGNARIAGARFRLPLNLPRNHRSARLLVAFSAPEPVSGALLLGGQRCEVLLCSDNVIALDIPSDLTGDPVLEGEIDDPAHRCILRSLRLVLQTPPELVAADPAAPGPDWAASADGFGPREMFRLTEGATDWHAPLDDALWLATQRAVLRLPTLPCGTVALLVTVLPIAATGQRLRIELGSAAVETTGPGPQTLRIALDTDQPVLRLVFICNRLIAAQAVDVGDAGMLGGAVLRVVPEVIKKTTAADVTPDAGAATVERQKPHKNVQDGAGQS